MADPNIPGSEKKMIAALLAFFLGSLGAHKFYLGYTKEGIIHIVLALFTCGSISALIAFIEMIMYLMKSDQEFVDTYVNGQKGWF